MKMLYLLLLSVILATAVNAAVVLDANFRPDVPFPRYGCFWNDNAKLGDKIDTGPLGGFLHVYVRNSGPGELKITDVLLDGVSLTKAIAFSDQRKFRRYAYSASIGFSELPAADKVKLAAAGEPVWWRFDPKSLKSGQCGELAIRLRHRPARGVSLQITFGDGSTVSQTVGAGDVRPRMESVGCEPSMQKIYLYLIHPQKGSAPNRILLDAVDITAHAKIFRDPSLSLVPVVCSLPKPIERGSLHCFQAIYPDGSKVTAAVRLWGEQFSYGMWGAQTSKDTDPAVGKAYIQALAEHNISTQMEGAGSEAVRLYMLSEEGVRQMQSLGIRRMVSDIGKDRSGKPWAYFLMDEPDAGDMKVQGLPERSKVGSLGQGLVERSFSLREADPLTPHLLNVDMTYKPHNWYTYAQLPDILTADPYYQIRLAEAYHKKPQRISVFSKPDFVHAVASVVRSAQAPKPAACVLMAGKPGDFAGPFRFATPEEKRMEVYYALQAGVKGISYWWFQSLAQGLSPGKTDPLAVAQWREIGLLGAEVGTAGPLLMTGCSGTLPLSVNGRLWPQAIFHGGDTIIIPFVNEDCVCDKEGTHVRPIQNVKFLAALPKWLVTKDAFLISYRGISTVKWKKQHGTVGSVKVDDLTEFDLGTVNVSKMLVITSDTGLRGRLAKSYDQQFAANVRKLLQ